MVLWALSIASPRQDPRSQNSFSTGLKLPNSSFGTARLLYGPDPRRNSQQKKLCTAAGVLESSLILGLVGRGLARDLGTSTRPDPSPPPNSWLVVASRFRHQTMTRLHERPSKNSSPLPFQNNESTSNVPVPRPPREAKHALPSRAPPNPARGAPFHRFDPGTHATKQKPTSQDTQVPHRGVSQGARVQELRPNHGDDDDSSPFT